jgi:hypothetical protein
MPWCEIYRKMLSSLGIFAGWMLNIVCNARIIICYVCQLPSFCPQFLLLLLATVGSVCHWPNLCLEHEFGTWETSEESVSLYVAKLCLIVLRLVLCLVIYEVWVPSLSIWGDVYFMSIVIHGKMCRIIWGWHLFCCTSRMWKWM